MKKVDRKKAIRYLIMDVDGTLTDGKIYIGDAGQEAKAFNIKDGYGIRDILPARGITPIIVTGRESSIVVRRCEELNIKAVYQGVRDKASLIKSILPTDELCCATYIGDDLNDLEIMKLVHEAGGIIACPRDAVKDVRDIADYVSECEGGNGAVRDFIDWLVNRM